MLFVFGYFEKMHRRNGFMRKSFPFRILFYCIGLLVLALGLTLNTKTGLGVSPIISVAYSISEIFDHNFGNMTLALYSIFVLIELVLHMIRKRKYRIKIKESGVYTVP